MSTAPQQPHTDALTVLNGIRAKQLQSRTQIPHLNHQGIEPARCQVVAIASGKGGTGKTLVACNLAVALGKAGLKVAIIDADFGLANAHFLLGINPLYNISHLMRGEKKFTEIIERGPEGVRLVPGGSGRTEYVAFSDDELAFLAGELHALEDTADIAIIDLPAGINPQVIRFLSIAHDIILVSNHEAAAQADVLATINILAETLGAATVHLVVNRARNRDHAVVSFQQIWNQVNRMWRGRIKLFFSGWIPNNWYVQSSVMLGKPFVTRHPQSLPTQCLQAMGARFHKHHLVWRGRQVGRWGVPSAFARLKQMVAG